MFRPSTFSALTVCAAALLFSSIASAQTKVGVVNFQKAIMDTAEIKKATLDLQNKYKPRQDALEKAQRELADIQTQLQSSQGRLSAAGAADLQEQGQRKQREAERLQQDLQDDVTRDRNDILTRTGQRMTEIVKKIAEEKGLDLVVDTQNTYFFKPALDITAEATANYDKAYPLK
ncbi:MAG TPA: OmpH family outer membrane protein [Bryobacteraceae bacterium]|jgi:outer membrane protein|nr:OmpH family outer membrane protein [Bryobacteraceae bacterium]